MPDNSFVLESPIEFAIIGPSGSRDRVLVKSKNAGLDLIGAAAEAWGSKEFPEPQDSVVSLWEGRQLNAVRSFSLPDVTSESDFRPSRFTFAWIGLASKSAVNKVEK